MPFYLALALLLACAPTRAAIAAPAAVNYGANVEIGPINTENLLFPRLALLLARDAITFEVDSPGGYVDAGFDFVNEMVAAQRRGVVITCIIPRGGMAASMAAYIFEACDVRKMHRQSSILFHSVSVSQAPGGTVDDIERFAREMRELNHRLAIFISGRLNLGIAEFERRIRGDWWLGWEEALEVGAVDGVL